VSKLTNRYVPVYLDREIDDHRRPKRIYPSIPDLTMGTTTTEIDVIEVAESYQRGQGSWSGWSGSYPSVSYPSTFGVG
jgi:hypothetical protein